MYSRNSYPIRRAHSPPKGPTTISQTSPLNRSQTTAGVQHFSQNRISGVKFFAVKKLRLRLTTGSGLDPDPEFSVFSELEWIPEMPKSADVRIWSSSFPIVRKMSAPHKLPWLYPEHIRNPDTYFGSGFEFLGKTGSGFGMYGMVTWCI